LKDIFVIQDDITKKIITALQVTLTGKQYIYTYAKSTDNLEAYLKLWQAAPLWRVDIRKNLVSIRQLAEEAIALDPNYARAYEVLGFTHLNDIYYGLTKDFAKSKKTAFELGQKAKSLDEKTGHDLLGSLYQLNGHCSLCLTFFHPFMVGLSARLSNDMSRFPVIFSQENFTPIC
jgi:hypothetical protein